MIDFNRPFLSGNELEYINDAISLGKISGNGVYTSKVHEYFRTQYDFGKNLVTTSCTDALEMAAILCELKSDDEVIVPSFTFVSSALPFVREGAKVVFADSKVDHPNMDEDHLAQLITERTRVIVVVHYAGVACEMDSILNLARAHNILVVEDAAQSIDSYYKNKRLGGIGDLSAFSFHETKNIQCGEGGLLVINKEEFRERSDIIWEKGTNRAAFFERRIDKYEWVDTGSSFLASELTSAFLFAQLENHEQIQLKRIQIWERYLNNLQDLSAFGIELPFLPDYATNNGHMFYLILRSNDEREQLIEFLKTFGISATSHYRSLIESPYYVKNNRVSSQLPNANRFTKCLLRLPLFFSLTLEEVDFISDKILGYFKR